MTVESDDIKEPFALQTTSTKATAKESYLMLLMNSFQSCVQIVGQPETQPSEIFKRIELMSLLLIHLIPNPKERIRLMAEREIRVDQVKAANKKEGWSTEEYNDALFMVNIKIIGEVMEVADSVLGVCERQYVLPVSNEDRYLANMKIIEGRWKEKAEKQAKEKILLEKNTKDELLKGGV